MTRRATVRATDLDRLGKWAEARGLKPVAADALPGGAYRLHFTAPSGVPSDATAEEERAWDEALD